MRVAQVDPLMYGLDAERWSYSRFSIIAITLAWNNNNLYPIDNLKRGQDPFTGLVLITMRL